MPAERLEFQLLPLEKQEGQMNPGQREASVLLREGPVVLVLSWQGLERRVPRALRARGEQEEFVVARLSCSGVLVAAVRCLPRVELHREDCPS